MSLRDLRESALGSVDIIRRGWSLLSMAFLVDAAFLFIFLIVLQSYLPESLHRSDAIAGYALAAFGLAKLATQVASGFVSDRLGTRRALILGTALLLLADVSILPLAHVAPWLIIAAGAIEGLGSSVTWPALYSAGSSRFGASEKGRFTALLTLASGGALLVGLGGGAVLNTMASFDAAMIAPIASVTLALILALGMRAPRGATETEREPLPSINELRQLFGSSQRMSFAAVVVLQAAAVGALTAAFRSYGRDVLDVSLAREGLLLVPAAVLGGLLVVPGGVLADRIGARHVMAAGFCITGACLLLLSRWSDPMFVAITGGVAGGAFGLAMPTIASTMMSLSAQSRAQGGSIGWFMTMDGFGHALGPATAGVLLGIASASAVMIVCGGLFVAVAYIALTARVGAPAATKIVAVPAAAGAVAREG